MLRKTIFPIVLTALIVPQFASVAAAQPKAKRKVFRPKMCINVEHAALENDRTICKHKILWALENKRVRLTDEALRRTKDDWPKEEKIRFLSRIDFDLARSKCKANVQCTISIYDTVIEKLRRALGR